MKFITGHDLDGDGEKDVFVQHDTNKITAPSGFGTIVLWCCILTAVGMLAPGFFAVAAGVVLVVVVVVVFPVWFCLDAFAMWRKKRRRAKEVAREEDRLLRMNAAVAKWERTTEAKKRERC